MITPKKFVHSMNIGLSDKIKPETLQEYTSLRLRLKVVNREMKIQALEGSTSFKDKRELAKTKNELSFYKQCEEHYANSK